jgi:dihydrofolate synthase/folylpolyglutamate synthase
MVRNFNLAKEVVNFTLQRDGKEPLSSEQIAQAETVQVPARAEKIQHQDKTVIMDGSHNPQKLQAFVDYLEQKYPSSSRTLIATLGINKIANLDESMQILRSISNNIILTSFKNESIETDKRISIDADSLMSAAQKVGFKTCEYVQDPIRALRKSLSLPQEQIVITGSFYLLDHLRPHLIPSHPSN